MASEEKEDEKLPLISYRKLKTNDREELDRLRFALVDGEHGFFQLDVDDEVDEFDQVAATEKEQPSEKTSNECTRWERNS